MSISSNRKESMSRYNSQNKSRILFQSALYRDKLRLEMVEAYGGKCLHCGESDPIVLTLDHINNDPGPEYKRFGTSSRGGYTLYRFLRKQGWPKDRFQLLCFNCNMKKEHKRRREGMVESLGPQPEIGPTISRTLARAKASASGNSKTGFKGIWEDKARGKWVAKIRVEGKVIVFGRFDKIADAAFAYRDGVKKIFGDLPSLLTDKQIMEKASAFDNTVFSPQELGL